MAHPLIQILGLGSAVSFANGSGQSPATKQLVVHFEVKSASDDSIEEFFSGTNC